MADLFPKQNQIAFPQTLAAFNKVPVIGNRIFATLADAQKYVDTEKSTAIPGIYLSVIKDGENNGAYWVKQASGYDGAPIGILQKIGEGVEDLKTSLGLKKLAYKDSIGFDDLSSHPNTLEGYGITKSDIVETIGISAWALASTPPSKVDVGLGNVDNIAAKEYFGDLSINSHYNWLSITIGGTMKTLEGSDLKSILALGSLADYDSVDAALGYTPLDSGDFTKENIGLDNVENVKLSTWSGSANIKTVGTITSGTWNGSKIANDYLANDWIDIAGTTVKLGESIPAGMIQTAMDLKALAYKDSIGFDDLSSHPNTLEGYGITDALKTDGIATEAERLADKNEFTIWGNTFFRDGQPKKVSGDLVLDANAKIKIGSATISVVDGKVKIDADVFATGALTAGKKG